MYFKNYSLALVPLNLFWRRALAFLRFSICTQQGDLKSDLGWTANEHSVVIVVKFFSMSYMANKVKRGL